ncbi:MAG: hypothetical protein RMK32_03595 [Anaerolineae bacterium]|nr:hypothetical protein [Thermoflexus sp.]MDW8064702.1 hypothetical protein [Anaerolineae bacterium]
METLWALLSSLAPILYGGISLLLITTLRQAWQAYRRRARAFFRVEREMAAMDLLSGLARGMFLLVAGLGLWLLLGLGNLGPLWETSLPPSPASIPSPAARGVRSPVPWISPSPYLLPTPSYLSIPLPSPSPIPSPSPSPTATATSPPIGAHCSDPNAQIEYPLPGEVISRQIILTGTATHSAFQFYKVEIEGPYTEGRWITLGDVVRLPVIDGQLWVFDPHPFFTHPGRYRLRLVVVDVAAQEVAICEVPVVIAPPEGG